MPTMRGNTKFPAPKNMQNMAKPAVRTVLVKLMNYKNVAEIDIISGRTGEAML